VQKLGEQIDVYECEIDMVSNQGGKKAKRLDKDVSARASNILRSVQKQERVASLKARLEKHKQHTCQLEVVMRLVNIDSIACDMITDDMKVRVVMTSSMTSCRRRSTTTWRST